MARAKRRERIRLDLNAIERALLTELLDTGLFGMSLPEVIKRIVDERLQKESGGRFIGNR